MPKLPKPFSRPSIDLGAPERAWQDTTWDKLRAGDIVPDYGVLEKIELSTHETSKRELAKWYFPERWTTMAVETAKAEKVRAFTQVNA